jgi:serine protease Do
MICSATRGDPSLQKAHVDLSLGRQQAIKRWPCLRIYEGDMIMHKHSIGKMFHGNIRGFTLGCLWAAWFMVLTPGLIAQTNAGKPDLLHQLSASYQQLVKKVSPSVVQVLVTGYASLGESSRGEAGLVVGRQRSIGSGVIIDPEGYIATNAHVVGNGQRIQIVLPPPSNASTVPAVLSARGRVVEAHLVGISREIDLALLKIEVSGLPALSFAKYINLRQGEMVFAFGSPEGLRNSVTMGVVSSVARQLDPDSPLVYIQTDAPINPGNSGGPLVNVDGELVGLSTFILTQSGGNEGLGFAIPSGVVAFAYPQLKKYGHIHRGEMGVQVQTITPALSKGLGLPRDWGVIISDVLPGGPADQAGLKIQDIVLNVDGRLIDSLPLFGFTLLTRPPGETAIVEVLRGTEKVSLAIPVVEQPHRVDRLTDLVDPEKNLVPQLGVLGIEVNAAISQMISDLRISSGVIVVAREANTGLADSSLTTGDVIHAINGSTVTTLDGLRSTLQEVKPGSPIVLQIERAERLMYLTLEME